MDTTEELNGTYFYHGQSNLSAGELFDVIFLEQFCDELGIGIESGAAILAGQPWLKTRTKPGEAIKGTSVVSKYGRMLLRNAKTPFGIRVPTPVGVRMRKTNTMDILLMKSIQDQVLDLFKDEISTRLDKNWKEIPLELDYDLFDAPGDDLHDALNKFEQKFNVDLSSVKWSCYFPWENTPMLTRWGFVE